MPHPYGCCVLACSAVFGTFLAVLGALPPRLRIGDCMKCCCECHCSEIPSHEAMDDRLYWVEITTGPYEGTTCAAWRNDPGGRWKWLVSFAYDGVPLDYTDEDIRIIHEIIPED